jgi:hypothetical protein
VSPLRQRSLVALCAPIPALAVTGCTTMAGTLTLTEQRGDWIRFGARTLTRIVPEVSPEASPSSG